MNQVGKNSDAWFDKLSMREGGTLQGPGSAIMTITLQPTNFPHDEPRRTTDSRDATLSKGSSIQGRNLQ